MPSRTICGLLSILGALATCGSVYAWNGLRNPWASFATPIQILFALVFLLTTVDHIWTILWWIAYTPVPPTDRQLLPNITVVIPVYNESHFVRYALHSILQSSYPKHRLEVVVVDDGSSDDSWDHISDTATVYVDAGIRYRTVKHDTNMGKRSAIISGFSIANGDFIVSLDSDSVLERSSLSNLVAPMVLDARIGGVAGHLSALNVDGKLIPRLLDILFESSGNTPRAAQSRACGAVTILPGALSAYRTVAIRPLFAGLRETTFLGSSINHGEDVELTLGLLRSGWTTVYQSNAVVHTIAPESARRAFLMYTRWERSSYVYLCLGFFQVAVRAIVKQLTSHFRNNIKGDEITKELGVDEKEEVVYTPMSLLNVAKSVLGSLFLLVNMTSTAVGNLLFPFLVYSQASTISLRPQVMLLGCISTLLLAGFRTLLFYADCGDKRDDTRDDDSTREEFVKIDYWGKEMDELKIYGRKERLLWRLQYGGLAMFFHSSFITWTSLAALLTLKSQQWLTR
ncbi:Glycosyltransferase family 2 protein [Pyrenophora tritici-repentis]|uniref:Glycos-transf-2 multi-domain protein n=2 Tax=Pyrenophora tritici-repentis TaxID=45151 RepID=A0A2W1GDJ3_9PLEO|nr:N-acetylglucosaminyltransferase [Pyrenophora tritici-repentis Pt-1C-BFP]KAA8615487.1 Glycosyltransferase family 2 protein [Pyrenophora tritici-repentis]EDU51481.1 N-acetylglucosaminyltransferase [Pyrenophora tritici-repentis Pt-1C-BFP]KAF7443937.1 Glycosyltransferase family 2 protein [Pyrenophora tritici-repentis]KAF7566343.1 Glycos-transf-2 multi-domain protein [Pyrenophora tritici-repentis]KAI0571346.1 Glycosyltransferase family 2 protein [Pyrenophora tritici-repentis]